MKKDLNDLKKITNHLKNEDRSVNYDKEEINIFEKSNSEHSNNDKDTGLIEIKEKEDNFNISMSSKNKFDFAEEIREEETLSIQDKELELIIKALERNNGKRKAAASELGISERTLYRKIKQHDIEL
jgi:DNA-binding NtrC family response regulator